MISDASSVPVAVSPALLTEDSPLLTEDSPLLTKDSPPPDVYAFTETADELPLRPCQPIRMKPGGGRERVTFRTKCRSGGPAPSDTVVTAAAAAAPDTSDRCRDTPDDRETVTMGTADGTGPSGSVPVRKPAPRVEKGTRRRKEAGDGAATGKRKCRTAAAAGGAGKRGEEVTDRTRRASEGDAAHGKGELPPSHSASSPRGGDAGGVGPPPAAGVRVRKSQRCNRGKKYQELISQGLIQPSRANARRYEQTWVNAHTRGSVCPSLHCLVLHRSIINILFPDHFTTRLIGI